MRHKKQGFTIVELLVVTAIISVLAAMLMMASDEAVSSAKAAEIVSNLNEMKAAINAWYTSNFYRVDNDGRVNYKDVGIATGDYKLTKDSNPIQEISDDILQIRKYFSNNKVAINVNLGVKGSNMATDLEAGHYAVYDAGNGNRRRWWIGYSFKEKGEDKVKDKLDKRQASLGLRLLRSRDPDDLNKGNKNNNRDYYGENLRLKDPKTAQSVWIFSGIGPAPQ